MDSLRTRQLSWHGHLLLIHHNEQERRAGVATWVNRGLELGEKTIYIEPPGEPASRSLMRVLDEHGVSAAAAVQRGQLQIVLADYDVYSPEHLGGLVDQALLQGYPAVRFSGEAATACNVVPRSDHMDIEWATDRLCHTQPVSVMCQYSLALARKALPAVSAMHLDGVRERLLQTGRRPDGIALVGEVDVSNRDVLHFVLQAATVDVTAAPFVVDLSSLEFLDVAGARTLLTATKSYREGGGRVLLREPKQMVSRVLELCGVEAAGGLGVDSS